MVPKRARGGKRPMERPLIVQQKSWTFCEALL